MTASNVAFAALVLAARATTAQEEKVGALVRAAQEAGAALVIAVLPRGARAPTGARTAMVAPTATAISAMRAGMALLSNTMVRHALLLPLETPAHQMETLGLLVDAAASEGEPLVAFAGTDLDRAPVMIARDSWLELMTLGEQGMAAVAARRGVRAI
jgi:hypothetical protein